MAKYDVNSIRNFAFVGHGGSGKTLLTEAILLEAGLATRVPAGLMDYATDEKERGHSIESKLAQFSWKDKEITIIDTPGYQEFVHNAIGALSVVETAVLMVGANSGVTINTRKMWEIARKNNLPTVFVVTKLDAENTSFSDTVAKIQKFFGEKCLPFIVPSEQSTHFKNVQDAFASKGEYRDRLMEAIVETNDEMLNQYLEGKQLPEDQIKRQFRKAFQDCKVFPIFTVLANQGTGVKAFMENLVELAPSPIERDPKGFSSTEPFSGRIFKIYNDPFGRVCYFKAMTGSFSAGENVTINADKTERVGHLVKCLGKEQKNTDKVVAGEIAAVTKVEGAQINDTFTTDKTKIYPPLVYPVPMVGMAVQPLSRNDEQKISSSLHKLSEEDPTFKTHRDEETAELIASGMSNLHLDIVLNRLKTRFKVESTTRVPRIAYRETITTKAEARHRHKKQSGGHGQFAEVAIKIEPTERGKGFEFVDQIVGGVITSQFVVSTEKGIKGILPKGIIAGYPIVDVRVYVWDGKMHDVDSSDAAFQLAGSKAFQEAFVAARPVLLEPIENIEITVPADYMGAIMGDLNSRRGRIMGTEAQDNYQTIIALVPLSEIMTYSADLKALTGGEGTYSIKFSHYDPVPSHLQEKIIAKSKEPVEPKKQEKGQHKGYW